MKTTDLSAGAPVDPTASWTDADWEEFKDLLYRLDCHCGAAGTEDRARVLVAFCIGEGINIVGRIINLVAPLGFDNRFLGALLTRDRGGWFRTGPGNVVTLMNG